MVDDAGPANRQYAMADTDGRPVAWRGHRDQRGVLDQGRGHNRLQSHLPNDPEITECFHTYAFFFPVRQY